MSFAGCRQKYINWWRHINHSAQQRQNTINIHILWKIKLKSKSLKLWSVLWQMGLVQLCLDSEKRVWNLILNQSQFNQTGYEALLCLIDNDKNKICFYGCVLTVFNLFREISLTSQRDVFYISVNKHARLDKINYIMIILRK